ncbi:DUF3263 domain-containing protein [Kocuria nitroreducens]|uniref:DUF3263 domain-containing protein n=1 Tax=Kocuria nitroreducens TaxID=3058914 RepID=UPI0036DF686C
MPEDPRPEDARPEDARPDDARPDDARPDDAAPGAVPDEDTAPGAETRAEPDAVPAGEPGDEPDGNGLGATDRAILALENLQWKYQGAKEMEIHRRLNLSPTHYYQRLNVLIDTRAALEHDPMLVARLRRQRGDRG